MKKSKRVISFILTLSILSGMLGVSGIPGMSGLTGMAPSVFAAPLEFKTLKVSGERSHFQFGRVDFFERDIIQRLPFDPMLEGAKIEFSIQYTQWYNLALYRMPDDAFERRGRHTEIVDKTTLSSDYYGTPDPITGEMPEPNISNDPRNRGQFLGYLVYTDTPIGEPDKDSADFRGDMKKIINNSKA